MSRLRSVRGGPVFYGVVGTTVLAVVLTIAVAAPRVLFQFSTDGYVAEFVGAAGIDTGDEVHVAGVRAGKVTSVALAGDRVRVRFRIDQGERLHTDAQASIRVATVLGKRYVSVDPGNGSDIAPGTTLSLRHTSVPYSLGKLAKDAGHKTAELDKSTLRSAMETLRDSTQDSELVDNTIEQVTELAQLVNDRDAQFDDLLSASKSVTSNVLDQRRTLLTLLGDADKIASVVNQRQQAVNDLISDVEHISTVLDKMLGDTKGELGPLLSDLHELTDSLEARDDTIGKTLKRLEPGSRHLANATGNGPWGDVSAPAGPVPDNVLCTSGLLEGCQ